MKLQMLIITKITKNKDFYLLKHSDCVHILLINVEMPTLLRAELWAQSKQKARDTSLKLKHLSSSFRILGKTLVKVHVPETKTTFIPLRGGLCYYLFRAALVKPYVLVAVYTHVKKEDHPERCIW